MGGTNDPENLVKVTVEQHAALHKQLWEDLGDEEDKIAWLGLSGLILKEDVMKDLYKLGRKKANQIIFEKYRVINPGQLEHNKKAASQRMKKMHYDGRVYPHDWTGRKHKEESKKKIGEKNSIHQQGSKNSQYGTCWITNGEIDKKIKKNDLDSWLEKRYTKGRKINYN